MSAVEVSLGEVVVGVLSRDDDTYGSHRFVFDANYVSRPRRPLLGQIFEDWIPDEKTKDDGILPWFDHLLPLAHLPQRKAIARDAGIDPDDDLAMLAWLGDDLLGAVRMRVIEATPFRSRRAVAPLVQASEDALYRASLPGAQWKLSLAEGYKGLTLPLKGAAGAWIAKFHSDIVRDAVAREYATMTWARHAGLDVPEIRMVSVDDIAGLPNDVPRGDGGVYLIRRFDRAPKGVRIHTEDFAQILDLPQGPEQFKTSHEAIAHVLAAIAGPCDVRAYLRHPRKQCSPPRKQCSPPRKQCSPPRKQCSPPRKQCSPPRKQCSPPQKQCSPRPEHTAPPEKHRAPLLLPSVSRRSFDASAQLPAPLDTLRACGHKQRPCAPRAPRAPNR